MTVDSTPLSGVFTKQTAVAAGNYANEKAAELKAQASDGDFSIRLLGLIGGFAMVVVSVLGFLSKVLTLDLFGALVAVYTFMLGLVIIALEGKKIPGRERVEKTLHKYCMFLKYVWGRGMLYFVAGTLKLTGGNLLDLIVGGYVMLVGVLYIFVGRQTSKKLTELRKSMFSEATLRAEFAEADVEGKGSITRAQFKNLLATLGVDLNRRETETAFLDIDKNDQGVLTVEQFLAWWNQDDEGFAFA